MPSYIPPTLFGQPEAALAAGTLADLPFDAIVLVAPSPVSRKAALAGAVGAALASALAADAALDRGPRPPAVIAAPALPGGRLVLAPMGGLDADTDDVRSVAEAAAAGTARAVDAGAARPLVWVHAPDAPRFARAREVAALSALGSQWTPLEAREAGRAPRTAEAIGVVGLGAEQVRVLSAIERGRALCRDITGTEPERMAPRKVAELCAEAFIGTGVEVAIEDDVSGYPLIAAVSRASMQVERHRPCVVRLGWAPAAATRAVVLAGKGVTYDTGGADLKTDGAMAGMSRDKGGAGAVAGLVLTAALLNLPVRVTGLLGMVRNSVGEESFVSDEIIRARSGVRVRIGNTDAEGRLVLADLCAAARSLAGEGKLPATIFSVATLTGHVYRAFGPYVGAIGNGAAQRAGTLEQLDKLGEAWGEPMERSRPRREDYLFVAPRSSAEDVVSSNRLASVNTPRGHQFPFAFIDIASGMRGAEVPFVHLDIGGVALDPPDWQFGKPTGNPIVSLTGFLMGG